MQPMHTALRSWFGSLDGIFVQFRPKIVQLTNEQQFKKLIFFNILSSYTPHAVANLQHRLRKHILTTT